MEIIQPMAAILLVLALLAGALYLLKKRGSVTFQLPARSSTRQMQVMERVALGPQHSLHLVRIGGRSLVISTAPSSCQLICEQNFEQVER